MPKYLQPFVYEVPGTGKSIVMRCPIKPATKSVVIELTTEMCKSVIKRKAWGNAQQCAGAMCAQAHSDKFPHNVVGPVIWTDYTAKVLTKVDRDGHPSACVNYSHNHSEISKLFDQGAKGARKLLELVEANGGSLAITLTPPTWGKRETGRKRGRNTGERTVHLRKIGAKGRFIRVLEGLTPARPA